MVNEWICSNCGHLNSGKVSGMQMGGSFESLVNVSLEAANTCNACGKKRSAPVNSQPMLSSSKRNTGGITCFVILIIVIVIVYVLPMLN
jgi:hypothetical protein